MQTSIHTLKPQNLLAHTVVQSLQINKITLHDIAQKLDYPSHTHQDVIHRLIHVLESEYLGLYEFNSDFKYNRLQFLIQVFTILHIQDYQADLERLIASIPTSKFVYKLLAVFVYPAQQPSFLGRYAIQYSLGEIKVPKFFAHLNEYEQWLWIHYYIQQHYQLYHQRLPYNADIQHYVLSIQYGRQKKQCICFPVPKVKEINLANVQNEQDYRPLSL